MKKLYVFLTTITFLTSGFAIGMSELDEKLFAAVRNNNIKEAKKALKNGANPNTKEEGDFNVLHSLFTIYSSKKIINPNIQVLVFEKSIDFESLKKFTRLFINFGTNIDSQDKFGFSSLHRAILNTHSKDIIKMLIDAGANPFITDNKGNKPLDRTKNIDIIIMLEQYENMINNTIKSVNKGKTFWEIGSIVQSITLPQWTLIKDKVDEYGENENALEFFIQLPDELRELNQVKKITKQDNIPFIYALNLLRLKIYPYFDDKNNNEIMNKIAYTLVKPDTNKKSLFEGIIEQGEGSFIDIEKSLLEKSKKRSYKYWYKLFSDWRINDKTKNYLMEQYLTEFIF